MSNPSALALVCTSGAISSNKKSNLDRQESFKTNSITRPSHRAVSTAEHEDMAVQNGPLNQANKNSLDDRSTSQSAYPSASAFSCPKRRTVRILAILSSATAVPAANRCFKPRDSLRNNPLSCQLKWKEIDLQSLQVAVMFTC